MAGTVKEFTTDNFNSEVLEAEGTVLVDFWATWCGPCRLLAPMLDELASENPNVSIGKLNVDEHPDVARTYQVQGLPTLLVFKNGEITDSFQGLKPKAQLQSALD
ncbi:MAG: thioredoxin [Planctomycetota bacterium]